MFTFGRHIMTLASYHRQEGTATNTTKALVVSLYQLCYILHSITHAYQVWYATNAVDRYDTGMSKCTKGFLEECHI